MENRPYDIFVRELRKALRHFYSPAEFRKSGLLPLFVDDGTFDPVQSLRQVLADAIQALNPGGKAPLPSSARRAYEALHYRYIEQTPPKVIANTLGVSVRQLQRLMQEAEQNLADYLWGRYDLGQKITSLPYFNPTQEVVETPDNLQPEATSEEEQELQWLKESFPSEIINLAEVVSSMRRMVKPLTQALHVQQEWNLDEDLPPVIGQRTPVMQALLNLLMAAIHSTAGGTVRIRAHPSAGGIQIQMEAVPGDSHPGQQAGEQGKDIVDYLNMARKFTALFDGSLNAQLSADARRLASASLVLPSANQVPVLIIDDNTDTLRLIQRYLAGTRYRFLGAQTFEQALALIDRQAPQCIVLDVMLPGVDDWELLGRLREYPSTHAMPIIICTILPQEDLALALGADAFLRKPVSRASLLEALDQQMRQLPKESR